MALVINGRFLQRPVTGVERYGRMLLRVIAEEWPDSRVVIPSGNDLEIDVHGLELVRSKGVGGHAWEQLILPHFVGKNDLLLSPANTGPLRVRDQAVVVHDLAVVHHPEWFDRRFVAWYNFLLPRLARRAVKVITVSRYSAMDLQRTYELHPERICVIPPFVPPLHASAAITDIGSPYFLIVGSLDPRKGLDRVTAWYRGLADPNFNLVCVGRSGKVFRQMGIPELPGLLYLNDVGDDRLSALYKGALGLIQPSYFEGFGLPILEAMQHGCPVIAADLPVFHESFGDAILYTDMGDPLSVDQATARLSETGQREQVVRAGRVRASTFTQERMTEALHSALDPLLAS